VYDARRHFMNSKEFPTTRLLSPTYLSPCAEQKHEPAKEAMHMLRYDRARRKIPKLNRSPTKA